MIHPCNNATQTRWDRGELEVQLNQCSNARPIGFCDGSAADRAQIVPGPQEQDAAQPPAHGAAPRHHALAA
jgi:hypothetical protein